jgi:signal transduction histidine kinase
MSGTKYARSGFHRITQLGQPVQIRLFGFTVVVICGGLLLGWITHTTWSQLDHLQKEHAAVKSESFYLGVNLRGGIRGLNERLVQFNPRRSDAGGSPQFFREADDLNRLIATNRVQLVELAKLPLLKQVLIDDFDILAKIQTNFSDYLKQAAMLQDPTNELSTRLSFEQRYNRVRAASEPVLQLCSDLVRAQRDDFTSFLGETQSTLVNHERMLQGTLAMIVGLAGALAILLYRGMIAPLRLGLTQSKTIIARQEKLASLGVLASGVAHEIRNPLTAIKFRLFSLKKAVPVLNGSEDARLIGDEINRLESIVRNFLRFARPSEPDLSATRADRIVKDVHDLMNGQLERAGIDLKFQVESRLWVHADGQQMKQVLINLIQNAAEAIGRNGSILVEVRTGTAELEGREKTAVLISVADTGRGIAPGVESRLFDPFFTTKEGGTGLGLAIAARIVEKHGGALRYETELNRGTTFEIVLPLVEHEAAEALTH